MKNNNSSLKEKKNTTQPIQTKLKLIRWWVKNSSFIFKMVKSYLKREKFDELDLKVDDVKLVLRGIFQLRIYGKKKR